MRLVSLILFLISCAAASTQAQSREMSMHQHRDASKIISIYPNPATDDFIYVRMEAPRANVIQLTLHNIIGNEIQAESEIVNDREVRIRIKDLSAGYYLLAVRDDEIKFRGTYKFLKR